MKQIKKMMFLVGAMFATFGLVFMAVGAWQWSVCDRLTAEGIPVQAVCHWLSGDELRLEFEAEGQIWSIESDFESDSLRTGDEVTVYYPIGHPEKARMVAWWTYGIFLIIGGIFGSIGLGFVLWQWRIDHLIQSLQMNGQKVTAQVTAVKQLYSVRVNGRNPYVVYAVYKHPYTGNEMNVKSRLLMDDPSSQLTDGTVEVLVDMMNEKRYHVMLK